jgi:hypothetical protein
MEKMTPLNGRKILGWNGWAVEKQSQKSSKKRTTFQA